jgi:hypothetical protein
MPKRSKSVAQSRPNRKRWIMKHQVDDAMKIETLTEHLVYRLNMLNRTFSLLEGGLQGQDQTLINALIESFCINARHLIEFFKESRAPQPQERGRVAARHFTDNAYKSFSTSNLKAEWDILSDQTAHFKYGRRTSPPQKIGPEMRKRIKTVIDAEFQRFVDHLRPEFKAAWKDESGAA